MTPKNKIVKTMTFKNIIKDEIKGNLSTYKEYFLATILSVTVIMMSMMVLYHPQLQFSSLSQNFVMAGKAVTCIIGIFLFIFIYYSEYTFIKHRSRDYAMFSILGMKRSQLTLMNFCESFAVFFAAFISGILLSMLFAKLIFMAFAKILDIDQMGLYLPWTPLAITAAVFFVVFAVIEIASALILRRTRVKDFLQFGRIAQKQKKVNLPVAIIGALLMLGGYYLAVTANEENLLHRILPVCLMVIAGMYCFYREICPFILQMLSKNKGLYYKGVNMLWISDLKYRIKDFTMMLFLITVTMTVGLTGFSAVFNVATAELKVGTLGDTRYPIAVMYMDEASPVLSDVEKMLESHEIDYQKADVSLYSNILGSSVLIRESDLHYFLLEEDMAAVDFSDTDTVLIKARGKNMAAALPFRNVVGVKDDKVSEHTQGYEKMGMALYQYTSKDKLGKELMYIMDTYYADNAPRRDFIYSTSLFKYFYFIARRSYLLLSFYFVIIFYICAGCMLYFKFFNNALEESEKYSNYSKVGLSNSDIRRSSTIQMAALFFLPSILTILNTGFAMFTIRSSKDPRTFILTTVSIMLFTLLVQLIYFLILRRSYLRHILPTRA